MSKTKRDLLNYLLTVLITLMAMLILLVGFYFEDAIDIDEQVEAQLRAQQALVAQQRDLAILSQHYDDQLEFYSRQISETQEIVIQRTVVRGNMPAPPDRIRDIYVQTNAREISVAVPDAQKWFIEDTNSMLPTFDAGATVLTVKPSTPQDVVVGDIIFFDAGPITIVHRVIEVSGDTYITQGDNNLNPDEREVDFKDIEGVVIGVIY